MENDFKILNERCRSLETEKVYFSTKFLNFNFQEQISNEKDIVIKEKEENIEMLRNLVKNLKNRLEDKVGLSLLLLVSGS